MIHVPAGTPSGTTRSCRTSNLQYAPRRGSDSVCNGSNRDNRVRNMNCFIYNSCIIFSKKMNLDIDGVLHLILSANKQEKSKISSLRLYYVLHFLSIALCKFDCDCLIL